MSIRFAILNNQPISRLTEVFNASFANYFVPLSLTEEQLAAKFAADNARPDLSIGAFDQDELVGFIFHGIDTIEGRQYAYNGGTGVLPAYRGRQLAKRMYEAVLPLLKDAGVRHSVLEVVTQNERAIRVYESVGFTIDRKVDCYRGTVKALPLHSAYTVRTTSDPIPAFAAEWGDVQPTWQNNNGSVTRQGDAVVTLVAHKDDNIPKGFLQFNKNNGKLLQIAVAPEARQRGVATDLISVATAMRCGNVTAGIEDLHSDLVALNVDESATHLHQLLLKMGLQPFLSQYEMSFEL